MRYSDFCIFVFPCFFLPVSNCFRGWSNINLIVYGIINCLNKNLITHFLWYLGKKKRYGIESLSTDRVLNKEHFYGKKHTETVHQKLIPDPLLILVNNPKQPLHARNYFESKIFWKMIIKKVISFFLSNPVPLNRQNNQKQKGPGTIDQSLFRLWNKLRKIHLFVM